MANFRRKRPKKITVSDCGYKNCRYDAYSIDTVNGVDRYLPSQWRKVPYEGKNPWRHKKDIISAYYNSQGL